jgi:basic membrane lipoprotein Med (substrate-binding protein (PBP1-ABC) superfamily)
MWTRAALLVPAVALTGCGGTHVGPAATTTKSATRPAPAGLRIGVAGPLAVSVPGAHAAHGSLRQVADAPLVVVSASAADAATVARVADAHPVSHFALVGARTTGYRRSNVVGLVLRDDAAARLGGVVAGLVASDEGGGDARVAWVGPEERTLLAAFTRGVHESEPGVTVLHAWSRRTPAACKEAALGATARGAVVVMAHGGGCAAAAIAGANDQNHPGLRISDFELPSVAADVVARDAVAGVYRGKEDIVFGLTSGAIGVSHLDARIPQPTALRARAAAQQLANGLRPTG